jgi:hypothetical protein
MGGRGSELNIFKFSDNFNVIFMKKTYEEIVFYLNNKYENLFSKKKNYTLSDIKDRKIIKLFFLKFYTGFKPNFILKNLDHEKFDFKIDSNSPDYLIYSTFSKNPYDKKFKNAIKIAICTENKIPDFYKADYAIGHAHLNYLDRYCKIFKYFNLKLLVQINNHRKFSLKKKKKLFCAGVISNNISGDFFRLKFINELNKYKKVDMGGRYNNNVGGKVKNKIQFLSSYKFSIAMENSGSDGYYSEKIIQSFISGTIPIYYGDYMIDEYFNPKSFISIKGEKDMYKKIDYIIQIDNNDKLYKSILKEKVINTKNILKILEEQNSFLNHIFRQNKSKAFRIDG